MTLTNFLLARIAERESVARDMQHQERCGRPFFDLDQLAGGTGIRELIDPDCILAECEAKRRMVADLAAEKHQVVEDCWYTCPAATEYVDGGETCDDGRRGGACDCGRDTRMNRRLCILAAPYAAHPDYRDEWRP